MSVHLERATTRNLLDGLRAYISTFDAQLEAAHQEDATAVTESGEYSSRATQFSDVLPRLQHYGFVTHLSLIIEARLSVFRQVMREELDLPPENTGATGGFLDHIHAFVTKHLEAEPPEDLWRWMTDIALVKDLITQHAGSVTSLPDPKRRTLALVVRRRPGLEIGPDNRLYSPVPHTSRRTEQVLSIRRDFCVEAVTAAQGLFGYLYTHREPATR